MQIAELALSTCFGRGPLFANQVKSLELMLRVRERLESSAGESSVCADSHPVSSSGRDVSCVRGPARAGASLQVSASLSRCLDDDAEVADAAVRVLDEPAFARSRSLGSGSAGSVGRELQSQDCVPARRSGPSVRLHAHATVSENTGIIGLREISESDSPSFQSINSSMGVGMPAACARAICALPSATAAPLRSCSSFVLVSPASAAHALVSPLHSNSWSDTVSSQCPRRRKRVKAGVSCPAEDLRPVTEVEAGVNFRPAGGVRGQVAGSLLMRQPGTGTRQQRVGAVTPSLHPEVPDTRFVSPGRVLDIRQSMAGRRCVKPHGRGFGC